MILNLKVLQALAAAYWVEHKSFRNKQYKVIVCGPKALFGSEKLWSVLAKVQSTQFYAKSLRQALIV